MCTARLILARIYIYRIYVIGFHNAVITKGWSVLVQHRKRKRSAVSDSGQLRSGSRCDMVSRMILETKKYNREVKCFSDPLPALII